MVMFDAGSPEEKQSRPQELLLPPARIPLIVPAEAAVAHSQLTEFMRFCERQTGRRLADQSAFHAFSVQQNRAFWALFLTWSRIAADGNPDPVCTGDSVEHARFFPDLRLNYAENLLSAERADDADVALVSVHDDGRPTERLTRGELRLLVFRAAAGLLARGITPGDRVVAILRNDANAVVAALACAAIGAVFASVAPEMGAPAILARLRQLEPALLVAAPAGDARGQQRLAEVAKGLSTLGALLVPGGATQTEFAGLPVYPLVPEGGGRPLRGFLRLPFNHPLFILFSSGTTGMPKCIVHGAGGTLLEHLKEHRLHVDLRPDDVLFCHTSCAWMMWNWQLSALAVGTSIVLYDGAVAGPSTLWSIVAAEHVTVFGTSASYLKLCQDSAFRLTQDLPDLRSVLSTGSVLYDDQFDWVMENIKPVPVQSISGGTDILGCFVLGSPNLPVYRGEAQCRSLGMDVVAFGPSGQPGELVCRSPFPSRPLGFWGDTDGQLFHAAYFSQNPGMWTHGDKISFTPEGSARLHGRSDGVMNIRGIRIGPADIYAAVQRFSAVREALAVEQQWPPRSGHARIVLLVVLQPGRPLDAELARGLRKTIGRECSAAHVPAVIADVRELPTTHSGKRSETAARAVLNGEAVENADALTNPDCLADIATHPALRQRTTPVRQDAGISIASRLKAIWEDVFGFAPIEEDDNFFELGGDSLLAITLFAAIEQQFNWSIPMATLFQAPTIASLASLAAAIRTSIPNQFSCLVPAVSGSGRPLFVVHGLSGTVMELVHFVRAMRGGPPVVVIQAQGMDPASSPMTRVEDMAAHYLREIRDAQPHGPYALAGFSFGGLVAYEIASQLAARGEQVDVVAMIDTRMHSRNLSWLEVLKFRGRLLTLFVRDLCTRPLSAIAHQSEYIRNGIRLRLGRVAHRQDPALVQLPPLLQRTRAACEIAFTAYRPRPWSGCITFFRALTTDPQVIDPLVVWRKLTRVEEVALDCGHLGLIQPPHVATVAAVLRDRLASPTSTAAAAELAVT